jgi:hypothetical protein
MAHRPVGAGSSLTITAGAATTSSAFSVQSNVLRVVAANTAAHVLIAGNPSASSVDYYIPSGGTATLALTKASSRVVGVTTGATTTITVPEGTAVPFAVGDYVSLTSTSQSYYNFSHQQVLSVDNTSGVDGYHQTKMTVNYNSSGIVTAFNSQNATIVLSNKVSAFGSGGSGALYFQQVQISGQA